MRKVLKVKRKFNPNVDDHIFVKVRLSKDADWIYVPGFQPSVEAARYRAFTYSENPEYEITINGHVVERRKMNKNEFPGKIASAGYPTLGKGRP